MKDLLIHQWKEKTRSPFWQKSLWINIILGIVGLYLIVNFLVIGVFADVILKEIFKTIGVVEAFARVLFYYLAFDLILRFFVQQIPTLSIQPYLTLPIRKSTLLHYPLIRSIPDFMNLLALLLLLPFFVKIICTTKPALFSLNWIITICMLVLTSNFLNFSLKKYFSKRPLFILFLLAIVAVIIYLDMSNIWSCSFYFGNNFLTIAKTPLFVVIPVSIASISYYLGYQFLKMNTYVEDSQTGHRKNPSEFSFLTRFGEAGYLLQTEIKMILRNKRPKSLMYLSILFLAYGFMFYRGKNIDNDLILIFTGFFLTSIFGIQYGQFSFSWESSFFDSYMANKISAFNYIQSKYLLFVLTSLICFVITLPYALISYRIGIVNVAMLLYNIGITSVLSLYICTYNTKYIDLGRSQFMNYQGTGVTQFLSVIPIAGFPVAVFFGFKYLGIPQFGVYTLGLVGLAAIVYNKLLLTLVSRQFLKRKYRMALGFRQN